MSIGVIFCPVVFVLRMRLFRRECLQPFLDIAVEPGFVIVNEDAGSDVHGVDEHQAFFNSALPQAILNLWRYPKKLAAPRGLKPELFAIGFHRRLKMNYSPEIRAIARVCRLRFSAEGSWPASHLTQRSVGLRSRRSQQPKTVSDAEAARAFHHAHWSIGKNDRSRRGAWRSTCQNLSKGDAAVGGENLIQGRPAGFVHRLKRVQVDGNDFTSMFLQKFRDRFPKSFPGWFGRKIVDDAFPIMLDSKQVEEVANHFPMCTQQPDLEQLNGQIIGTFLAERLLEPKVPVAFWLSLDENWPELSAGGDVLNYRFVDRFLTLKEKCKRRAH